MFQIRYSHQYGWWEVGFWHTERDWVVERCFTTRAKAARWCVYLNTP